MYSESSQAPKTDQIDKTEVRMAGSIDFDKLNLIVSVKLTPQNRPLLRAIPNNAIFSYKLNAHVCPPTLANVEFLRAALPDLEWTPAAETEADNIAGRDPRKNAVTLLEQMNVDVDTTVDDYEFGTTPKPHQLKAFCLARGKTYFALLMDPRTMKTKVIIDEACWAYEKRGIRRMLVICPKNAKSEWEEQIPVHAPPRVKQEVHVYSSATGRQGKMDLANWCRRDNPAALQWLIINVDVIAKPNILQALIDYCDKLPTGVVIDESTCIKNPSAKRAPAVLKLKPHAKFRRIMTGTAPPNGPEDLFMQFAFLNANIIGARNITHFRQMFTVQVPGNNRIRPQAKDAERLAELIAKHSYRVRFEDVSRHIPRQDIRIKVTMSKVQADVYQQLKEDMIAQFEDRTITIKDVLVMGMRLMQVTGGFVRWDDIDKGGVAEPIPGPNAKLEALLEILARYTKGEKIVIWARFRNEIELIHRTLQELYGREAAGHYYGATPDRERERVRHAFQDPDSPLRFFVGNAKACGMAIPLWRANTAVYFSNDFDYLFREQSEFRIKLDLEEKAESGLGYYDLVVPDTFDVRCLNALARKKDVAAVLQGDNIRELLKSL